MCNKEMTTNGLKKIIAGVVVGIALIVAIYMGYGETILLTLFIILCFVLLVVLID